MYSHYKHFTKKDLPFNDHMKLFWDVNGFLIIDDFYTNDECESLRYRANELIKNFDPLSS